MAVGKLEGTLSIDAAVIGRGLDTKRTLAARSIFGLNLFHKASADSGFRLNLTAIGPSVVSRCTQLKQTALLSGVAAFVRGLNWRI